MGQATFPESRGYSSDWKKESSFGKEELFLSSGGHERGKLIGVEAIG